MLSNIYWHYRFAIIPIAVTKYQYVTELFAKQLSNFSHNVL